MIRQGKAIMSRTQLLQEEREELIGNTVEL